MSGDLMLCLLTVRLPHWNINSLGAEALSLLLCPKHLEHSLSCGKDFVFICGMRGTVDALFVLGH